MIDKIKREPKNDRERHELKRFMELARIGAQKQLSKSERKRYRSSRVFLVRVGIIQRVGRDELEDKAREALRAMPKRKLWALKAKFLVVIWGRKIRAIWRKFTRKTP